MARQFRSRLNCSIAAADNARFGDADLPPQGPRSICLHSGFRRLHFALPYVVLPRRTREMQTSAKTAVKTNATRAFVAEDRRHQIARCPLRQYCIQS